VVVKLNGQAVEGAEQLRRMLREIPAGRKVSLEISRDGNLQTLAVQLAIARLWNRMCGTSWAMAETSLRRVRGWGF